MTRPSWFIAASYAGFSCFFATGALNSLGLEEGDSGNEKVSRYPLARPELRYAASYLHPFESCEWKKCSLSRSSKHF